jgi:HEAT repeat protein
MEYLAFADLILFLGAAILVGLVAVAKEILPFLQRCSERRHSFSDADRSEVVRKCAARLNSRSRKQRLYAVDLLSQMQDVTAVPALLKAAERYDGDPPFVEAVVEALHALGDGRSVPALRRLSRGRNMSLMAAARAALEDIEPKSRLLRSAAGPPAAPTLLRPAGHDKEASSEVLLRPSP